MNLWIQKTKNQKEEKLKMGQKNEGKGCLHKYCAGTNTGG